MKYGPGSNVGIYTGKNCEVIVKNQVVKCTTEVAKAGYKRDGFSAYIEIMDQISPTELLNISFRTPTYVQASPTILNVMNLTNIMLSGNNFGPKGSSIVVKYGKGKSKPYNAKNCYVSRDHEEIKCQAVPIKKYYPRRSITFQIISDNHTNPVDSGVFVVGYASPNVSGLDGHSNLQTRGGETVVVKGKNFGMPMNMNVSIRTRRPDGFIVHWKNCSIESDTLILCQSEEGQGSQLQIKCYFR